MIDKTIMYRLIGAGVMVISAAIVLPLILDGERPAELDVQVKVTNPPEFSVVKIKPAQPVDTLPLKTDVSSGKSIQDITLTSKSKVSSSSSPSVASSEAVTSSKTQEKKSLEKPMISERWTVQIATFKSKDNAIRLVTKLKESNYDAYRTTSSGLHKVYVGPEFEREVSEKIKNKIKKEFNLSGIVIKFSVN